MHYLNHYPALLHFTAGQPAPTIPAQLGLSFYTIILIIQLKLIIFHALVKLKFQSFHFAFAVLKQSFQSCLISQHVPCKAPPVTFKEAYKSIYLPQKLCIELEIGLKPSPLINFKKSKTFYEHQLMSGE